MRTIPRSNTISTRKGRPYRVVPSESNVCVRVYVCVLLKTENPNPNQNKASLSEITGMPSLTELLWTRETGAYHTQIAR